MISRNVNGVGMGARYASTTTDKKPLGSGKSVATRRLSKLVPGPEADPGRLLQSLVGPSGLKDPAEALKPRADGG